MPTTITWSLGYTGLVSRLNSKYFERGTCIYILIATNSEMQGELPLWSSCLEGLGFSDSFPSFPFPTSSSSPERMGGENEVHIGTLGDRSGTDEEMGWKFYIGTICNRRTVNDMLVDMWRNGEEGWVNNVSGVVERTSEAVKVVTTWYTYPFLLVFRPQLLLTNTMKASNVPKQPPVTIHS